MSERALPDKHGKPIKQGDTVLWQGERVKVVYVAVDYGMISVTHGKGIQPVLASKVEKAE